MTDADKPKEAEPAGASVATAEPAAAAADADAEDDGAVKKKRTKRAAVDDDEPAPAATASASGSGSGSAAAAASGSNLGGDLESKFRAEIEAILKVGDITKLTLKEVRKLLTAPAGPFAKDVVSANKDLISRLLESAVIAHMDRTGMAEGASSGEVAAAAASASASAEDSQSQSQSQSQDAVGEEDAGGDSDDDAAGVGAGSGSDYEDSASKKKSKKSSKASAPKKSKKKRTTDSDGDDEPRSSKKRSGSGAGSKRKGGDGPEPPKKAKSAFIFFSQANRQKVKDDNPDITFGQIGKVLGDRWKALSDEQKKPFEEQANSDKKRYENEKSEFDERNPDYESSRKSQKKALDDDATGGGSGSGGGSSRSSTAMKPPAKDAPFFDHVLWELKVQRRKKKDKHSDEDLKTFAKNFVDKMDRAFDDDSLAIKDEMPGLNKLKLLPEVIANAEKVVLQEALRDAGILRAIGQWLNFISDGALPNLKLRTSLYDLLGKIKVEESDLNNSQGLGKLIMRLWDSKQETPENKKKLAALIEKWARPMLGASTDYKKLADVERRKARDIVARKQSLGYKPVIPAPAVIKRAIIPDAATFDYALRPESKIDEEEMEDRLPKKSANDLSMRTRLTKKIDPRALGRSRGGTQSSTVDITGNHIN